MDLFVLHVENKTTGQKVLSSVTTAPTKASQQVVVLIALYSRLKNESRSSANVSTVSESKCTLLRLVSRCDDDDGGGGGVCRF